MGGRDTSSTWATGLCRGRPWRTCRPWCGWCASSGKNREQGSGIRDQKTGEISGSEILRMAKQAVLLLAHGTPESIEQIPEYLRNVVSGRPLPQAVVEEIQYRYAQIGHSPLTEITFTQARLVEAELAAAGQTVPVYVG